MADITQVLAAMGQRTRLDALTLLSARRESGMSSGDIAARLKVPVNSMSTHLAILHRAGLVTSTRSGRNIVYRLNTGTLDDSLRGLVASLAMGDRGRDAEPRRAAPMPLQPQSGALWAHIEAAPIATDDGHAEFAVRPTSALSRMAHAAWLARLHAAAAERWLGMSPPRLEEGRSSLRAIRNLTSSNASAVH